ncbi:MBL fold metallo-hydrolase [Paenibacillus sp. DCT19]|uniref:MBL fold metallo-hydrolase n=1 Tax=Paenibacillus sp. DCT19 TaxID=2211212 RepID=UPI0020C54067|nr:MBL fold metallo-hydrolase [Paenibacillus sp. DCT19]
MNKVFRKKLSIGVMLLLSIMLILSACTSTASKTENTTDTSSNVAGANNTTGDEADTSTSELKVTTFNPGEKSIFGVSSNLIEGPTEVVLVDAQFQKNDAEQLVKMIKDTGKKLTTVFISHKDPDYYFGLSVIREAFPDVKIVATPGTVEGIKETIQVKNDYWNPILKENAPTAQIVPDVFDGKQFTVDGQAVDIIGLDGSDPSHTFLWIPSIKTVLGGVPVYENVHVWMADNQTPESRNEWRELLDEITALNPERVIPGHYVGTSAGDLSSVTFTRDYIAKFEAEAEKAKDSKELIATMEKAYPDFTNTGDLETSAQVIKGEISWP